MSERERDHVLQNELFSHFLMFLFQHFPTTQYTHINKKGTSPSIATLHEEVSHQICDLKVRQAYFFWTRLDNHSDPTQCHNDEDWSGSYESFSDFRDVNKDHRISCTDARYPTQNLAILLGHCRA